ncbi:hypothetical protein DPMN_122880 [Dreissena polymorpha]|uniref:Uncharacterized protein n=1 Tax=Dreissena polymorpha TaxID=45954 RepID=A0A9D4JQR8_DREPO|nr:hypothetical protein DPMN_122880 [Dreissena polymorpha]
MASIVCLGAELCKAQFDLAVKTFLLELSPVLCTVVGGICVQITEHTLCLPP